MLKRINRSKNHDFFSYINSNENIIELSKVLGAITLSKTCQICKTNMNMMNKRRFSLGYILICCICIKKSTFSNCSLALSKISPFVFLKFAFYFFFNKNHFTANYEMENTGIGEKMYRKIISFVKTKISNFVKLNKRKLGRTLNKVQIDETFWTSQKYEYGNPGIAT
ncbi:hypothetical protein DMUE_3006 [Dictyocoela muelleri]|nr:hypothetical protein DMUE_3006 [Dictyocoela muelleri]